MSRVIERILDRARWAPSGDNTQPWRFEILSDHHVAIHGFDTRDDVIYDFDGHPSHMAHGALLETLRIAATGFGLHASWSLRNGSTDRQPIYDVILTAVADINADPLIDFIEQRTVQRRPMRLVALTERQRKALAASPGAGYEVVLIEPLRERLRMATLLWDSARIRLTCPEAYPVHRDIIEWGVQFSTDRIPSPAVGADPVTARLMRWVMVSWKRVDFFNRYLMGTVAPRIQLDVLPAIFSSAHIFLNAKQAPQTLLDYVHAGVALQRLWLTATQTGLYLQPEMTPLIFRWYATAGRKLSALTSINQSVQELAVSFDKITNRTTNKMVFMCRVGSSNPPIARSLRKELKDLLMPLSD